eukprot:1129638-Prorocentrum_minimum.AAC.1
MFVTSSTRSVPNKKKQVGLSLGLGRAGPAGPVGFEGSMMAVGLSAATRPTAGVGSSAADHPTGSTASSSETDEGE